MICEDPLPDGSWRDVLQAVQVLGTPPALIVTSRLADNRLWAEVLNLGGYDVLGQPLRAQEVMWAVQGAHRQWRTVAERDTPQLRGLLEKEFEHRESAGRKQAAVRLFRHSRGGAA